MAVPDVRRRGDAKPKPVRESLARARDRLAVLVVPPAAGAAEAQGVWARTLLILLVAIPVAFNAIALLPELRIPIPSLNDDAFHYLFIQRASQALSNGQNPFDVWTPALELGFPQALVYQTLPHLFVVFLSRLLLGQVGLLTLFNLTRYLLMAGFPLTVYWSMRRLGFSQLAAAIGAAAAPLLATDGRAGLDYGSYVWRGFGMYTQLWAMHLSFITLALLDTLLERGKGYLAAVAVCALLVLCHLLYTEMMVVSVAVLFFVGLTRANARLRLVRLGVVGALTLVITSYFWLPFLLNQPYLNASVYLESYKYDSYGVRTILTWLVTGDLLDHSRLPVLTALLGAGIVAAVLTRTRPARLAIVLFVVWLLLYFGRQPWGLITDHLPAHGLLWFHRFLGSVHLAAILLIGLGGELLWRQTARLRAFGWNARVTVGAVAVVLLMLPVLAGRWAFYDLNASWMTRTQTAIDTDADAQTMLATVGELAPGRVFAGLRTGWGEQMRLGDIHFSDLLTFHAIPAVSPPYNSLSLNSDLIWHFDDHNPAHYQLFNARYVIAPAGVILPDFALPIKTTSRYTLYQVNTGGYAQYAGISGTAGEGSQSALFYQNRTWFLSPAPGAKDLIRWDYPAAVTPLEGAATAPCPGGGQLKYERVLSDQFDFLVDCPQAAVLAIKATYHPNWQLAVDGNSTPAFMLSPSLIGVAVPAGLHHIEAQYQPPAYPTVLMLLGGLTLAGIVACRRRIEALDKRAFGSADAALEHPGPNQAGLMQLIEQHRPKGRQTISNAVPEVDRRRLREVTTGNRTVANVQTEGNR